MKETLFKTLIILAIMVLLFYFIFGATKHINGVVYEGLENMQTNGEAGSATAYAASIKSEAIKLQDSLLVTKYRKDYENAIINLEDLVNFSMLKLTLNMSNDPVKDIKNYEALNTLNSAKSSLNSVMKFVDGQ